MIDAFLPMALCLMRQLFGFSEQLPLSKEHKK